MGLLFYRQSTAFLLINGQVFKPAGNP